MIETDFQEAFSSEWKRIHVPDVTHELHIWRQIIPWQAIIEQLSQFYSPDQGRIGNSLRIMVAMLLVQKLYRLSDREVVKRVQDSPYIQYFCNVPDNMRKTFISESSPLTRFRQRLGVAGIAMIEDEVFAQLKWAGLIDREDCLMDSAEAVDRRSYGYRQQRTVLNANILYPNDVLLLFKALKKMKTLSEQRTAPLDWDYAQVKKRWRAFGLDKKNPLATYLEEFFGFFLTALAQWRQQDWPEVSRWLPLLTCWKNKLSRN